MIRAPSPEQIAAAHQHWEEVRAGLYKPAEHGFQNSSLESRIEAEKFLIRRDTEALNRRRETLKHLQRQQLKHGEVK